jgi:hypothetical protein
MLNYACQGLYVKYRDENGDLWGRPPGFPPGMEIRTQTWYDPEFDVLEDIRETLRREMQRPYRPTLEIISLKEYRWRIANGWYDPERTQTYPASEALEGTTERRCTACEARREAANRPTLATLEVRDAAVHDREIPAQVSSAYHSERSRMVAKVVVAKRQRLHEAIVRECRDKAEEITSRQAQQRLDQSEQQEEG